MQFGHGWWNNVLFQAKRGNRKEIVYLKYKQSIGFCRELHMPRAQMQCLPWPPSWERVCVAEAYRDDCVTSYACYYYYYYYSYDIKKYIIKGSCRYIDHFTVNCLHGQRHSVLKKMPHQYYTWRWNVPFAPTISTIIILYKLPHPRMHWGWPSGSEWASSWPWADRPFLSEVKLMDAVEAAGRQRLIANRLDDVDTERSSCVNGRPGKRLCHITTATAISRCKEAPSRFFPPFLYYQGSGGGVTNASIMEKRICSHAISVCKVIRASLLCIDRVCVCVCIFICVYLCISETMRAWQVVRV